MNNDAFHHALQRFMKSEPTDSEVVAFRVGFNACHAALMVQRCAEIERHYAGQPNAKILAELVVGCPE